MADNSYWIKQANKLTWFKFPKKTIVQKKDRNFWFNDGKINASYNCIQKNILEKKK